MWGLLRFLQLPWVGPTILGRPNAEGPSGPIRPYQALPFRFRVSILTNLPK
jgi:hypothetical protein